MVFGATLKLATFLYLCSFSRLAKVQASTTVQNSDVTTVKCRPGYVPVTNKNSGTIRVTCVRQNPPGRAAATKRRVKRPTPRKPIVKQSVVYKYIPVPVNMVAENRVQTQPLPPITRMEPSRRKFVPPFSRETGNFDSFYIGAGGYGWFNVLAVTSDNKKGSSNTEQKAYQEDAFAPFIALGGNLYVSDNFNLLVGFDLEIPIPMLNKMNFDQFNVEQNIKSITIKPLVSGNLRVGLAITEKILPYVKGGVLLSKIDFQPKEDRISIVSKPDLHFVAFQLSTGIDFAINPNIHFQIEYTHVLNRKHDQSLKWQKKIGEGQTKSEAQDGQLSYSIASHVVKLSLLFYL